MLTSKQRAYLTGLANHLSPVVSIGKNGVTPETVQATEEAFNTQELIKGAVQKACLTEPAQSAQMLAERTRSELVQVIGRKFILYRRSKEKPVIELPVRGKGQSVE